MRDAIDVRSAERGFTLLDTLVALAIASFTLLAVAALHGFQPPEHRVAAMALQGALAETRALAASNAATTTSTPTGATLTVVPLASGGTRIAVFAARPIAGAAPLVADAGFPPIVLPVAITLPGLTVAGEPFTILVSSSGYASVAPNYGYDPARPRALANDPGCDEARGVTIAIADDSSSETHAFECRGAQYDATSAVAAKRAPQ
jgi:type II secretory pathway pseudopilin PulG